MKDFGKLFLIVLKKIGHAVEELAMMKIYFGVVLDLFKVTHTHLYFKDNIDRCSLVK